MEQHAFPPYVNVPPIAKTRSTSHLAPTPEHHRSVSYEETTTASTSTDSGSETHGPVGFLSPSVPVVRIRSESSQVSCESEIPVPAPRMYVAAYEYTAQKDDELDLPLGSIVKLVTAETQEDGWFRGELEGKVGLFPSNYARLLPEKDSLVEYGANEIQAPDGGKDLENFRIGHGATATVYKVDIRTYLQGGHMGEGLDHRKAALKRFNKYAFNTRGDASHANQLDHLKREANLVNGLSHNNIVRLLGICLDDIYFGLLLELCEGGSLRTVCHNMETTKAIPLGVLVDWGGQVADGMQYLIKEGYVHRDLKADNVLVKEEVCLCIDEETMKYDWCTKCGRRPLDKLQLKITDFGVTRKMNTDANRVSTVGTYAWLAPEAFKNNTWSESSDVWSFGVVLWELLSREEPYQGQIPAAIAFQIAMRGQSLAIDEKCPEKWKNIMQKCWAIEPRDRPTFRQLVQHFADYKRELEEKYVHVRRAPSIMAVKGSSIYTECHVDPRKEIEKMFNELYADTGIRDRKDRLSIAPETKARNFKSPKGKKLEITGPMGDVKHILSVQRDKANGDNFRIKYGDGNSTGGTLPRLNGRQSTLSISSPDLFQLSDIFSEGSSTIGLSASRISRQKAIRKKKNHNNMSGIDSPIVSPTIESDSFARIDNAYEVEPSASKEIKNGTLSKVWSKLRFHKRDSKEEDDKAGNISSRSSSTTSNHRIIAGPASRSAVAPPFLETGSRSRAQSAADCWDDPSVSRRNKVSPSDRRPVKQTNMTERFVKESDKDSVLRPSHLPTYHRKSALDQTIPASPNSPDSTTNFPPLQLSSRRTTAASSTDGAPSYEMLVTNISQGVGHGHRNQIIQPSLSDYVPIAAEQPTHYLLKNGIIYDGNGHAHGSHMGGIGHGKPTYYPVGGGCDDYYQVPGSGHVKPTPKRAESQYVHCKAQKPAVKLPTVPIKIHSESNLAGIERLNGIGNCASSYSLNEPPDMIAPQLPRISMSPPTRLAPALPPPRDESVSPNPMGIMDKEILKANVINETSIF
ncbi:unnamed protein product [Caenorhabditis sp. 36 PRJEB53466]|nr:unnamed protein product [Caenorhabditis sp. 36 PRJEB53466]